MCTVLAMYNFDVGCAETLNFQSENRNMSKFPSSAHLLLTARVTGTLATSGGRGFLVTLALGAAQLAPTQTTG